MTAWALSFIRQNNIVREISEILKVKAVTFFSDPFWDFRRSHFPREVWGEEYKPEFKIEDFIELTRVNYIESKEFEMVIVLLFLRWYIIVLLYF